MMHITTVMSTHVGQELRKVREAKGLTLEQAARDVCLRTDLLNALEESAGDDAGLPDIYRKLSLRMYARYLGVSFTTSRTDGTIDLSPVDGCVELAYSDKMREQPELKKRRTVGAGTVLAVSALLILTTGLWSLNAQLARLNFDERPSRAAAEPPVTLAARSAAATPALNLDDAVFLELAPSPASATPEP